MSLHRPAKWPRSPNDPVGRPGVGGRGDWTGEQGAERSNGPAERLLWQDRLAKADRKDVSGHRERVARELVGDPKPDRQPSGPRAIGLKSPFARLTARSTIAAEFRPNHPARRADKRTRSMRRGRRR